MESNVSGRCSLFSLVPGGGGGGVERGVGRGGPVVGLRGCGGETMCGGRVLGW